MKLAGVDTNVFIYAMKRCGPSHTDEARELRARTLVLLNNLDNEKTKITLPTVVIAELLHGIKPTKHGEVLVKLTDKFFVAPLDTPSAALSADLWIKYKENADEDTIVKRLLKLDVLIVATAKIGGASVFYSHDVTCRKLATLAGMDARDLPSHSDDLLLDAELRRGEIDSGLELEEEG